MVFDIDGVLLRGNRPLPNAREALLSLYRRQVPFILLTNGGGELEEAKAAKLSSLLHLPIHPSQVVLSHTPMRPLCAALGAASSRVLVLGCKDVVAVARSYGLAKVDTPLCLLRDTPELYPFIPVPTRVPLGAHRDEPFAAVLVLHDPNSWGLELQVALDVLRGGSPLGSGATQSVPYYASNPDLTFAGAYAGAPRLAGGAFTTALQAMWAATHPASGGPLVTRFFGKPTKETFDFAQATLGAWAVAAEASGWHARALSGAPQVSAAEHHDVAQLVAGAHATAAGAHGSASAERALPAFERICMVGDNPLADIRGANRAGAPWVSALVGTGVWQGEALEGAERPSASFPGVGEAVHAQVLEMC